MRIFKRISAGLIAAVTMAVTGVTAFAGSWTINYTYGAPSSVSNQFVRREYVGLSEDDMVYVSCRVDTGSVALNTTGFNPDANSMIFYQSTDSKSMLLKNPQSDVTIEFGANENRVVASGYIEG